MHSLVKYARLAPWSTQYTPVPRRRRCTEELAPALCNAKQSASQPHPNQQRSRPKELTIQGKNPPHCGHLRWKRPRCTRPDPPHCSQRRWIRMRFPNCRATMVSAWRPYGRSNICCCSTLYLIGANHERYNACRRACISKSLVQQHCTLNIRPPQLHRPT